MENELNSHTICGQVSDTWWMEALCCAYDNEEAT